MAPVTFWLWLPENSAVPLLWTKSWASRLPLKTVTEVLALKIPPTEQSFPKVAVPLPAVKLPVRVQFPAKETVPEFKLMLFWAQSPVKTRFPGIYIVPVTDSIGKDKLEWAIRRGAADFIEKPCSPDDVENILDILERDC